MFPLDLTPAMPAPPHGQCTSMLSSTTPIGLSAGPLAPWTSSDAHQGASRPPSPHMLIRPSGYLPSNSRSSALHHLSHQPGITTTASTQDPHIPGYSNYISTDHDVYTATTAPSTHPHHHYKRPNQHWQNTS